MTAPLPTWALELAVFDTETTGVDTDQARIVSAAIAVLGADGEVRERYDWLIDPGVGIPDAAARVHGITTEVARESGIAAAAGIAQILDRVAEIGARGLPLVAYNAPFDLSLLAAEARRHALDFRPPFPVIDPLVIDKQLDRYRRGKRTLDLVCAHYGVSLADAHDAGADAIAAGRVAQVIAQRFRDALPDDAADLHTAQVAWAAAQAENFQEYMRRVRDPNFRAEGSWPLRGHSPA